MLYHLSLPSTPPKLTGLSIAQSVYLEINPDINALKMCFKYKALLHKIFKTYDKWESLPSSKQSIF